MVLRLKICLTLGVSHHRKKKIHLFHFAIKYDFNFLSGAGLYALSKIQNSSGKPYISKIQKNLFLNIHTYYLHIRKNFFSSVTHWELQFCTDIQRSEIG